MFMLIATGLMKLVNTIKPTLSLSFQYWFSLYILLHNSCLFWFHNQKSMAWLYIRLVHTLRTPISSVLAEQLRSPISNYVITVLFV